jgi:hypothetical protein
MPPRRLLVEQVPAISASLLVAETFYRFHSFILEGSAFLATWYLLDILISRVVRPIVVKAGEGRREPVADEHSVTAS